LKIKTFREKVIHNPTLVFIQSLNRRVPISIKKIVDIMRIEIKGGEKEIKK
jgi:hypothetical protein